MHAALLHRGGILYFAGSEHDRGHHTRRHTDHTCIWSPGMSGAEGTQEEGHVETLPSPLYDTFCSGHAFMEDGNLLVAGGTRKWRDVPAPRNHTPHFGGLRKTSLFKSSFRTGIVDTWTLLPDMNPERGKTTGGGRWYPTLLTLSNGDIMMMSGHPEPTDTRLDHNNIMIEVFHATTLPLGLWTDEGDQARAPDSYPKLHLLPDGQVFCVALKDGDSWKWNPSLRSAGWRRAAVGRDFSYVDIGTTSVLLPLVPDDDYRARVLAVGREFPMVIDLRAQFPTWSNTRPRPLGPVIRTHANAVLLPDGTVLVVGGTRSGLDCDGVVEAELYNPENDSWLTLARAHVPRVYHSVALLLQDGRVWMAGSNHDGRESFRNDFERYPIEDEPGVDNRELRIEVFSPPYLFRGPRPTILSAPGSIIRSSTFDIETRQANEITSVALLRCGSVTHSFNPDQRYVGLAIRNRTSTKLTVTAPPNNHIAPLGYYLLFIVNNNSVPSVGKFIQMIGQRWRSWFAIGTKIFPEKSAISSIARLPEQLDLVTVGDDGKIYSNYWNPNESWHSWFTIAPRDETFPRGSTVSAVSRSSNNIDLFAIGLNGRIYSTYWNSADGWDRPIQADGRPRGWFPIDSQLSFPHGSMLSVVSRHQNHLDLFVVGGDGKVYSNYWGQAPNDPSPRWHSWFSIGTKTFPRGSTVSAVSRHQNQIDLFIVGSDSKIYSNYWGRGPNDVNERWHSWFSIGTKTFPQKSMISAVSRHTDQLDLFVVGGDGKVYSNYWGQAPNDPSPRWHSWFSIGTKTFPRGSTVSAVSRHQNQIDLFAVDENEIVYSTFWNSVVGWNPRKPPADMTPYWFPIGTETFPQKSMISAESRLREQLDLFIVGNDRRIYSNYWNINPVVA